MSSSQILKGHLERPCAAFSRDGKRIASSSRDMTIRIWDADTGKAITGPIRGHTDGVPSVIFSPDGTTIISGSTDSTVRLWDSQTGKAISEPLRGHTARIDAVAISPDGRIIISGSMDHTIRVWSSETGVLVSGPLRGHVHSVKSVAFSDDGKHFASCSADRTIRIWNMEHLETTPTAHSISKAGVKNRTFNDVYAKLHPFRNESKMEDGWVWGENSELLFWVPPSHWPGLWRP